MKKVLLFGFAFFCLITKAQTKNETINEYNAKGEKHGKWITYDEFEGDSLKTVSHYIDGVLNGEVLGYFQNGQVQCLVRYQNGKRNGKSKYFYKNGALSDVYISQNDTTIFHMKFTPNGELFQESDGTRAIHYKKGKPIKH